MADENERDDAEGEDKQEVDDLGLTPKERKKLTPGELAHLQLCKEVRGAAAACADSVEVPLVRPVVIAGATRAHITMRRMRAKDMMAVQKRRSVSKPGKPAAATSPVDNGMWLLALLADLAPDDLDELDVTDLDLMREALAGFQGGRPPGT